MELITREQVLKFRTKQNREQSRFYSGPAHAATSFGIMASVFAISLVQVSNPSLWDLLAFPLVFVAGNFFIYVFHRWILHVPLNGLLGIGYKNHTLYHHIYYTYDLIEVQKTSEIMYILFPIPVVIGILSFAGLPVALLFGLLISRNAGWLAMAGSAALFFVYELIHGMCHLPMNSFIFKIKLARWIARHHRIHHRPELCNRFNFDIIIPSFDYVFGTAKSPDSKNKEI